MNIYVKELKAHFKSLVIWSVCSCLMVVLGMIEYEGYSSSGQSINDVMAEMPHAMQAMMGISDMDLTKASGYYGLLYLYLLLMATIHAVMLGATIIAKEERDKTVEFLFVKPVSRNKIITTKLLAACTNIVIFNLVTFISSIILVGMYSGDESVNADISITMAGMFILQLLFLFFGSALAAFKKKSKRASALAAGVLLLSYVLSVAIDINKNIEILKYLTPFKYFEAKNVMFGGGLDIVYVLLSIIIIGVLGAITFISYQKRDLNV
jgi:ABC-2 type transport system permease protein